MAFIIISYAYKSSPSFSLFLSSASINPLQKQHCKHMLRQSFLCLSTSSGGGKTAVSLPIGELHDGIEAPQPGQDK